MASNPNPYSTNCIFPSSSELTWLNTTTIDRNRFQSTNTKVSRPRVTLALTFSSTVDFSEIHLLYNTIAITDLLSPKLQNPINYNHTQWHLSSHPKSTLRFPPARRTSTTSRCPTNTPPRLSVAPLVAPVPIHLVHTPQSHRPTRHTRSLHQEQKISRSMTRSMASTTPSTRHQSPRTEKSGLLWRRTCPLCRSRIPSPLS